MDYFNCFLTQTAEFNYKTFLIYLFFIRLRELLKLTFTFIYSIEIRIYFTLIIYVYLFNESFNVLLSIFINKYYE
jgi:hypothetical protein